MAQFAFQSASELTQQLRDGKVSSLELVDYFIARIEKYDGEINAVVVRDFDRARVAARKSDEARSAGNAQGRLHGLPMT
ncbi:MAG: amidase family protein, partial [Myxococcota bacterium]